jgi:hypothetical protein
MTVGCAAEGHKNMTRIHSPNYPLNIKHKEVDFYALARKVLLREVVSVMNSFDA